MKREKVRITESGTHTFGENYKLIFINEHGYYLTKCNITCGNYCIINCGWECNITCGNDCIIKCGWECNITCGSNCIVDCQYECNITCSDKCIIDFGFYSHIKAGEGTKLQPYSELLKTISKGEEFIWWYFHIDSNFHKDSNLINTYQNVNWQKKNPEKFKELYPFVHNELDSATLF